MQNGVFSFHLPQVFAYVENFLASVVSQLREIRMASLALKLDFAVQKPFFDEKSWKVKNVHFRENITGFPVHNRFANWLFIQCHIQKLFHF